MIYAYIRVSSAEQNSARQEIAIQDAGYEIKTVFTEVASGKDTYRPKLQQLLALFAQGDTLVVHSEYDGYVPVNTATEATRCFTYFYQGKHSFFCD
ncbi:recombinase family protein [Photorhabdus kleinii]|uniref:recombinase family protein n=1 Tax=Photorhabdus kleinii TaxID=768034 RepID=UPI0021D4AE88|nr:recombinase family protein [Photorhabdus kleinii]